MFDGKAARNLEIFGSAPRPQPSKAHSELLDQMLDMQEDGNCGLNEIGEAGPNSQDTLLGSDLVEGAGSTFEDFGSKSDQSESDTLYADDDLFEDHAPLVDLSCDELLTDDDCNLTTESSMNEEVSFLQAPFYLDPDRSTTGDTLLDDSPTIGGLLHKDLTVNDDNDLANDMILDMEVHIDRGNIETQESSGLDIGMLDDDITFSEDDEIFEDLLFHDTEHGSDVTDETILDKGIPLHEEIINSREATTWYEMELVKKLPGQDSDIADVDLFDSRLNDSEECVHHQEDQICYSHPGTADELWEFEVPVKCAEDWEGSHPDNWIHDHPLSHSMFLDP